MTDNITNDDKISLLLTDDHQIVIDGLIELLTQDPRLQVVGYCSDGSQVLDKVRELQPDVLVMDISMPGMNGLEACWLVKSHVPDIHVMMLTMHSSEEMIVDALRRGASGYLVKEAAGELCQAIHQVCRGEIYLGQGIPRRLLDQIGRQALPVAVPACEDGPQTE